MIDDYLTYTKFITGLWIELIPKVIFQHEPTITKLNWQIKLILNIANSSESNINMTTPELILKIQNCLVYAI